MITQGENQPRQNRRMAKDKKLVLAFSQRFVSLLEDRGLIDLPDRELAQRLGKTNTTIWNWRNAEKIPSYETCVELAVFFGVTVDWIMTGRGPKYPASIREDAGGYLDISELTPDQQVILRAVVDATKKQKTECG